MIENKSAYETAQCQTWARSASINAATAKESGKVRDRACNARGDAT
ncbi:MAG: hypothetical protein MZU79_03345 [Anaerotruncus sp.]|nr:hypothetical protein [Anaerotruncus sp.]